VVLKVGTGDYAPCIVMDVIASANALASTLPTSAPGVIRMEVGQPGTGAPKGATDAVVGALQAQNPMGYAEAFGLRP
jgi:aspartate/methionine/tyrosine aminotransferase